MKNNIRMIACVIFSLFAFVLVGTEAKAEEENILYVTFPIPAKVQIGDVPDMYEIDDYISNYSSNYDEFASADFEIWLGNNVTNEYEGAVSPWYVDSEGTTWGWYAGDSVKEGMHLGSIFYIYQTSCDIKLPDLVDINGKKYSLTYDNGYYFCILNLGVVDENGGLNGGDFGGDPAPEAEPETIHEEHAEEAELVPTITDEGDFVIGFDGMPEVVCSICGEIHKDYPVYQEIWMDEIVKSIEGHKNFDTDWKKTDEEDSEPVTIKSDTFISFDRETLSELGELGQSVTLKFLYNGSYYSTTIPEGADFVSLADENGWAGFAYIMSVYGGIEITAAEFAA